jgi:Transposase, Mutator family
LIVKRWRANWERIILMFGYPAELRKIVYTTNVIESLNFDLDKIIKNRAAFSGAPHHIEFYLLAPFILYLKTGALRPRQQPYARLAMPGFAQMLRRCWRLRLQSCRWKAITCLTLPILTIRKLSWKKPRCFVCDERLQKG